MSKDIRKHIHRIYGIALSAVIVIVGIRFILGCYEIYTTGKAAGGQIYSRAAVAEAFAPMAISVYLCLALVIGSFILHFALPHQGKKQAPEKNRQLILDRLYNKTDMDQIDPDLYRDIARLKMSRRLHTLISAVLLVLFSAAFMVYACRPTLWPEALAEVTGTVVQGVFALLIALVIPTGYTIFTAYFCRKSQDKEIELMKQATKQAPRKADSPAPASKKKDYLAIVRYAIVAIAIAFIIFGYVTGGIADVIAKAAAICTECVGLG